MHAAMWPLVARAPPPAMSVIGFLSSVLQAQPPHMSRAHSSDIDPVIARDSRVDD
jgi:hypothetical protein